MHAIQRRLFLKALLAQSSILLLAACSQPAPVQPTTVPVPAAPRAVPTVIAGRTKLTASFSDRSAADTSMWLAKEAGIYDKYGLDVDLQFIASSTGVPALISDDTQVALIGGSEIIAAVVGGSDLVIPIQLTSKQPYLLEVAPDIKTADDLRGKKIGVSQFGSTSDTSTRLSLRQKGIDPETEVTLVSLGSLEARTAAMLNGAVQAGLSSPPDTLTLEDRGWHPLFNLAEMDLPPILVVNAVKRSTINAQRDLVQRYVNAIVEAASLIRKDRAKAIATMSKYMGLTDPRALDLTYEFWTGAILKSPPAVDTRNWGPIVEELAKRNDKARGFDPDTIVDTSLVSEAVANGLASSPGPRLSGAARLAPAEGGAA